MRDDDEGASVTTQQPVLLGQILQTGLVAGEGHPHGYG
jgi:hypothetical protein